MVVKHSKLFANYSMTNDQPNSDGREPMNAAGCKNGINEKVSVLTDSCYSTHISALVTAKSQCNFATYTFLEHFYFGAARSSGWMNGRIRWWHKFLFQCIPCRETWSWSQFVWSPTIAQDRVSVLSVYHYQFGQYLCLQTNASYHQYLQLHQQISFKGHLAYFGILQTRNIVVTRRFANANRPPHEFMRHL